jgi:hypothetical protein
MEKGRLPGLFFILRLQGRKLCCELVALFAYALENVSGGFVLLLRRFLVRLDEIRFPVFGAHLDLLGRRNPPLDALAAVAPAIGWPQIVDTSVLVCARLYFAVHDSLNIRGISIFKR